MQQKPIPAKIFVENRQRLMQRLHPNSLAVVNANDVLTTSADATLPIHANSDLFYLTGISQEQTILLLAPHALDEKLREVLFIREPDPQILAWEGDKLTKEQVQKISGIASVKWLRDFPSLFHKTMCEVEHIYLNSNEHPRALLEFESRDTRFVRQTRTRYPLHQYHRLARILHELRMVKSEHELKLIRAAIDVSGKGFLRVARKVKPGMNECEVEAEFAHEFLRSGARFAFPPIIASGINFSFIHYIRNNRTMRAGELILLDVAARVGNYNSDVTRTIPVSGRFTRRQRQVYNAVLRVLRAMVQAATPGKLHCGWQKEAEAHMTEELLGLGLLKPSEVKNQSSEAPACKKYFRHGIGHSLGLDVHDVTRSASPFAPGWVLAIEPGIYIAEEGFGIRLENDIVITEEGQIDLTEKIPIEAEEIEALMRRRKPNG